MAERSIIDQLDDAVAAMAEGRQLDLTNFGRICLRSSELQRI